MGIDDSSDDDLVEMLNGKQSKDKNIGIDEDYSDDGAGLYSEDESEYEEEGDEVDDVEEEDGEELEDDEEVDGDEEEADELEGEDEEEDSEGFEGSEFDDGDPQDLAQEGDEDSDFSDEEVEEPVSKKPRGLGQLAKKLAALEEEIADIESKQIEKKHWTLTGEVTSKARPLNSILESNIELPFGHMAGKRLDTADLIADENDFDPENPEKPKFDIDLIIKQRVADRTFDDVIRRKIETSIIDDKPRDRLEGLDFEKSQLGLAEVYAKQYEKDVFNQSDETEKKSAELEEAKTVFAKLMHKLDCLTNFNFAPRPPVVTKSGNKDLPAMKLEEPVPLIVSSSIRANK